MVLSEVGVEDEAGEPVSNNNDDDSSTSEQLQLSDISVTVVDDSPEKTSSAVGATNNNNSNAAVGTASVDASNNNKRKRPVSLQGKNKRRTRITETIMGSLNEAISSQASSKSVWKKEEIEAHKEMKSAELALQQKNYFLSRRKITAEVQVMNKRCEVKVEKTRLELEKTRREADLLEEQKKQLMQDRLKKLLLDRKELLDMGVPIDDVNLLLPLQK